MRIMGEVRSGLMRRGLAQGSLLLERVSGLSFYMPDQPKGVSCQVVNLCFGEVKVQRITTKK